MAPTAEVIKELDVAEDDMIGLVVGSIQWVPDLIRAGIKETGALSRL